MLRFHLLTLKKIALHALEDSDEPEPTMRERYWFSVAWPNTGGFVVAEWDTNMYGIQDALVMVPMDVSRLLLCTTMDGKVEMLKQRFQGRSWHSVEECRGNAFISCWESKEGGEVERLQWT
jgi:hypothetical protein